MNNPFKRNSSRRDNVGHKLQYEVIDPQRRKYKDPLVAGAYHDFFGNYSRKEVVLNDAIGEKLTKGFMDTMLMKYPKFVENDEVQSEYIMEDVRTALQLLNLKDPATEIYCNCMSSGWSHVLWGIEENQLTAKVLGWDECHPRFWTRFSQPSKVNVIYKYKAYYIPYPHGRESAHYGMKAEKLIYYPQQENFQHLTRGSFNYGFGYPRIQPIWDAMTKLRERSDSESFRSSNFMEARYPPAYKATGQAKEFIDKVRKTDRTQGIAIEEYLNPKSGDATGLPHVTYRPWSQGTDGGKFDDNKAGGFLDNEWARLLLNLGYSQVWAVGTQAGQTEGSEINLTRDDRADIAEFSLFAPIIKKILKRLTELGIFDLLDISPKSKELMLSESYQIVSWKTWEYNDKMSLQAEQLEHQMEMERGSDEGRNDYDQKENAIAPYTLIHPETGKTIFGYRTNINYPMTAVESSTVKAKGVFEGDLLAQFHESQGTYRFHMPGGNEEAEEAFHEMSETSPGGFIWDRFRGTQTGPSYFSGKPTIGGTSASLVPYDIAGRTPVGRMPGLEEEAKKMREKKMKGEPEKGIIGAGTTRKPMGFDYSMISPKEPKKPKAFDPFSMKTVDPMPTSAIDMGINIPYTITKVRVQTLPPLFTLSRKRFNEVAKDLGVDTFGSRSIDKVKELVKKAELYRKNHQVRYNSMSMGNPMAFGIPLFYDIEGKISEEYPCKSEWKKIENHDGNLWLYDDLGHGGERINVGTYNYTGWDNDKDLPIVNFDYNEPLIRHKINNANSEIIKRLDAKQEPEMSTEYFCKTETHNGKTWQMDFRDSQGRPRFDGIAIVEFGNCPIGQCNFERVNI